MSNNKHIAAIVAVAADNAIGRQGQLLCHLPADLKHFKTLTMGHSIIMGRRTFESFPKGALPGRQNIVISRQPDYQPEGAVVAHSPEEAFELASMPEPVFIIGGEQIYRATIDRVDTLYLTLIHARFEGSDAYFPVIDDEQWEEEEREYHRTDDRNAHDYTFITLRRKHK